MTELEKKSRGLPVESGWDYADAPEARDIVSIDERYGLFVGGDWVEPRSGEWYTTISPATEEPLAEVAQAGPEDVKLAVDAARGAYENGWSALPGSERAKYLFRISRLLQERAREFAVLESLERRQADPRVTRRRPAARCRALLLLRGLGRQARVRLPEP